MSLESDLAGVDKEVMSDVNKLSEGPVVGKYSPLFERLSKNALDLMRQANVEELKLGDTGIYFREDGEFYRYSEKSDIKAIPEECSRPEESDETERTGMTRYHSNMRYIFNMFRQEVKALAIGNFNPYK